jgi:predicted phage terminase large subunit-like protein
MLLEEYNRGLGELVSSTPKDQQIALMRYLCRTDLYYLIRYGMNRADIEDQWLFDRCREVQHSPDEHLDLWSRDHYKTTIITIGKTIQDIFASHGSDPLESRERTFGIFSHTRPISKAFLRVIKRELEGNINFKTWFPDILYQNPARESPKWSEDDGIIVKRTSNPNESTVEAWGVVDGQPISKHFTDLVYDDIVTRDSVNTPEMINKTTESVELSFALGTRGGRRRFIGTRYHFNDTYRTLIQRGTVSPRMFPATDDGTPTGKPVFLTQEQLDQKRRDMGPYTFSAQMLQNPIADSSQGFNKSWIKYYDDINQRILNKYILVDGANSQKKGSDYTAIWVIGAGADKNLYVLDMIRDRLSLTDRTEILMSLHLKYQPMRNGGVRYEKYGLMTDIEHIKTVQGMRSYHFDITEVRGNVKKEDRIRRLIPLFEQGRIYLPRSLNYTGHDGKTSDLVRVFVEEEYTPFPVGVNDDLMDSLARIVEPDHPISYPRPTGQMGTGQGKVNTDIEVF